MLTPRMERDLDSFQHKVVWRLTRRKPRRLGGESLAYPPLEEAMGEAGFKGIMKYVARI